jgi:cytochrome c553
VLGLLEYAMGKASVRAMRNSKRSRPAVRLALLATATAFVIAPDGKGLAAPDIELGRHLANQCMTCHRTATTMATIPNIFGMAEPRFTTLMKAYREKQLPNPVMQTIAARLTDDEIEALAAHFSRTKRP